MSRDSLDHAARARLQAGDGWLRWLAAGPVTIRPRSDVVHSFATGADALAWLKRGFEIGADTGSGRSAPSFERITEPDGTTYLRARFARSEAKDGPRKPTPAVPQFYRSAKCGGWAIWRRTLSGSLA